jgi:IS605 OrfB family transposase
VRCDRLHRVSTPLVREAQVIAIEALRVKAMARAMGRRAFRRDVADAALGELRRRIRYKGGGRGARWGGARCVLSEQAAALGKRSPGPHGKIGPASVAGFGARCDAR